MKLKTLHNTLDERAPATSVIQGSANYYKSFALVLTFPSMSLDEPVSPLANSSQRSVSSPITSMTCTVVEAASNVTAFFSSVSPVPSVVLPDS